MTTRFKYLPQLDGLRGVAVLMVVMGHVLTNSLQIGGYFTRLASIGVMLFFVLSGYLITGLLCDEYEQNRTINLRRFYRRRALRILPAVVVYLAVVAVLCLLGWVRDTRWRDLGASFFFLRNFAGTGDSTAHLWSLSIEQQFYLCWPLLLLWTHPRRSLPVAGLLMLAVMIWRGLAVGLHLYPDDKPVIYFRTDFRIDALMAGCALAIILHQGDKAARCLKAIRPWVHPIWVFPVFLWWGLQAEFVLGGVLQPFYYTGETLFCAALVYWLVTDPGSYVGWAFCRPWLRWVGLISYSLYLWQEPFVCVRDVDWGWARKFPVDVVLAFAAATASYYFVERPFLKRKNAPRKAENSAGDPVPIPG